MSKVASKARQAGMSRAFAAAFAVMVAVALLMTTAGASFAYNTPAAPVISSPPEGSYDNDGAFILKGTAERNTLLEVYVDGENFVDHVMITDGSGQWQMPIRGVADGKHTYRAISHELEGGTSDWSNTRTVIVDTKAPAAPYIGGENKYETTYYFQEGKVVGTAEPNSTVEVFVTLGETTSLGTVQADSQGKWSKKIVHSWYVGTYYFQARATDRAGNVSGLSNERTVNIMVEVLK